MLINSFTTPRNLANILGTSYSKLIYRIYKFGVDNSYKTFSIDKKSGGTRTIRAPEEPLKFLQRRLVVHLEKMYSPHPSATAFIKGRVIIYNASKHIKKKVVLNLDLEKFYDSIHFGRVRGLLIAKPYSLQTDTATIIAHICCVEGILPQGAPTSPIISNMLCRRMDKELSFLAKKNKAHYSRYADDITFSFRQLFTNEIFHSVSDQTILQCPLIKIISDNGFKVNDNKTRSQLSSERQTVTGLKVNRKVNVDRRYIRTTRAMLHALFIDKDKANKKFIEMSGNEKSKLSNVILGRLNYISMVKGKDASVYQSLARKFNSLDLGLTAPLKSTGKTTAIDKQLKFSSLHDRTTLEKTVWVIDFENVKGITLEQELIQGSAFMVKGNKLLTCAHTFEKSGNPNYCFIYRINDPAKKFKATIKNIYTHLDIAELEVEIEGDSHVDFKFLKTSNDLDKQPGFKVSLVGFPQKQLGHQSVTVIPTRITNTFRKSTVTHIEVEATIQGGMSGGPVINGYMKVVGMAVMGTSATFQPENKDENIAASVDLEGNNAFLSAAHFPIENGI
jgi:RNA-directed DNA polymerase